MKAFHRSRLIEYSMVVGLVVVAAITTLDKFGYSLSQEIEAVAGSLEDLGSR